MVTPGVKITSQQVEGEQELPERDHTRFRAQAARANYLAADRPDIMYAVKELCRGMAKPTVGEKKIEETRSIPIRQTSSSSKVRYTI